MDYEELHNRGLYSEELEEALGHLKKTDIKGFIDLIIGVLRSNPEEAVNDGAPAAHKIRALNSIQEYLIDAERYEDCSFIKDLIKKIDNES
jgi:hypothetical protein